MTNAVSFAYTTTTEVRLTLLDQFIACRNYAAAHDYVIVGEFNEIDTPDHQATGAGFEALRNAVAHDGAAVILVCEPSAAILEQLDPIPARIEQVAASSATR